ncbi:MAG: tetratricopeptide repeat protein [Thermodesulfovibrio sp.]|nr:tetratricopeptide repeat protein [Thermodesulfovibrio sp.]
MSEVDSLKKMIEERKFEEAISFIEKTDPSNNKYEFYKLSAEFFMKRGKYLKAIDYFKLAFINANTTKDKDYTLFKRGECYLNLKNFNEAKLILHNLIKNSPNSFYLNDAYLLIAQAYEGLGDGKEAIHYYQKVQPTLSAQIVKAKAYVRLNRFDEAIKIFENIAKTEKEFLTNNPDIYYYYGEALRNKGRLKEAKTYLSGAKRLKDFEAKASLSLGLIAYAERDNESAINFFNEAERGNDREAKAEAIYYLGKIYLEKGKKDIAKGHFEKLRNNFPVAKSYEKATVYLITLSREEGDYKNATKYIDELLKLNRYDDEVIKEIEYILNDLSSKNSDDFTKVFEKYLPYLYKTKRFTTLIKHAEKLSEEKKLQILERVFLLSGGEDKKKSANLLFEYYLKKGEVQKALKLENYVDKALSERLKLYDYLIDGSFDKAFSILEKVNKPIKEDVDNFFYLEKKISNKNKVKALLTKWIKHEDLEWEIYRRIGDYYFYSDKKIALECYKKALSSKNLTKEDREGIEKSIIALQNGERLPNFSKSKFDETLNKIKEQEKKVESLIREYNL